MGIFDIFKKKPKFIDDVFGELGYSTFKDKSKNFYEGTITFDSQQCGIGIDADENGPTDKQKEFFKELCDKYTSLKTEVIIPFLDKELKDWTDNKPIVDFDREFTLDGISIDIITDQPINWSLTLYSTDIKHWVTINFTNWQPEGGVIVDG